MLAANMLNTSLPPLQLSTQSPRIGKAYSTVASPSNGITRPVLLIFPCQATFRPPYTNFSTLLPFDPNTHLIIGTNPIMVPPFNSLPAPMSPPHSHQPVFTDYNRSLAPYSIMPAPLTQHSLLPWAPSALPKQKALLPPPKPPSNS